MRTIAIQRNLILKMLQIMGRAWSVRPARRLTIRTVQLDWEMPRHRADAVIDRHRATVTAATYRSHLV